ncbi:MAG: 2-C-methyl-D-erythritol 4-phosphate cytidylyltransferase [Muribaculaceae bacterium]|nr:2-C-methyl-D-erythritol 4-phosphate cytidylyltransferase [Muribaculaceae bacterium]
MASTYVIIVAAGNGSRFGSDTPKQFLELEGKPVAAHAVDAFRNAIPDAEIILVLSEGMIPFWQELCEKHGIESPRIATGGATRWESVKNALDTIAEAPANATILIHDGARPLVTEKVITRAAACVRNTDGAIPAIPVSDSLRQLDNDDVRSTPVDRTRFRAVQTPQAFTLWRLREAYSIPYRDTFTDDASVLAAAGFENIMLTDGSPENIKITTPVDLLLASAIIKNRTTR